MKYRNLKNFAAVVLLLFSSLSVFAENNSQSALDFLRVADICTITTTRTMTNAATIYYKCDNGAFSEEINVRSYPEDGRVLLRTKHILKEIPSFHLVSCHPNNPYNSTCTISKI